VGDEKEAALSVANRGIFAPEPGRVMMAVFGVPAGFLRGVFEWISDHGDRDLPVPSLLLQ
jgi:hypothetical protein